HRGVADELLDDAAEPLDLAAERLEEELQALADVLGVALFGMRRRIDDVDEEHRDELAFLSHRRSLRHAAHRAPPSLRPAAVSVRDVERPSIRIVRGGPMLVDGLPLGRLAHDGDAWRVEAIDEAGVTYAICRCGTSSTMPLCDRDAPYGCFDEAPA